MAAFGAIEISDLEAECLIDNLLTHIGTRYLGARPIKRATGRLDARRIARVNEVVESRLNKPPTLREMAVAASMSPFHFQRAFRATTGLSPHEYVAARRMERAWQMLRMPGNTVAQIAATIGFADVAHFRRAFRRQFNSSPRGSV